MVHGVNGASFSAGLNALDFIVYNMPSDDGTLNASGLRVNTVTATTGNAPSTSVSEPGALMLFATGLAGWMARRWRSMGA